MIPFAVLQVHILYLKEAYNKASSDPLSLTVSSAPQRASAECGQAFCPVTVGKSKTSTTKNTQNKKPIPNSFSFNPAAALQVHISYLEIYNETGYDLLNPDREVQMLEDLPKVAIMEDEESNIHMRNLSIHRANNEEEALNLVQ